MGAKETTIFETVHRRQGLPVSSQSSIHIRPYLAFAPDVRQQHQGAIDDIFFTSSNTQTFPDRDARRAFHHLWLGRYLTEEPEHAFLAIAETENQNPNLSTAEPVGYLVGSTEDPAHRACFKSQTYFQTFAAQTALYPAHLHINLADRWRGQGIGERLVDAFLKHLKTIGSPGVHVVTGAGMRNVRFYNRLGFLEVARLKREGDDDTAATVMLARRVQ